MNSYMKILAVALSTLSLMLVFKIYDVAVPSAIIASLIYLLDLQEKKKAVKNSELISFIENLRDAYLEKKSMQEAIESLSKSAYSFSDILASIVSRCKLGAAIQETIDQYLASEASRRISGNMRMVLKAISDSAKGGANIADKLYVLALQLDDMEKARNNVASWSNGMDTIAKFGVILFFPLFSGITAAIISGSSGIVQSGIGSIGIKFSLIVLSYVTMVSIVHSVFSNFGKGAIEIAYRAMPTIVVANLVFFAASRFLANFV